MSTLTSDTHSLMLFEANKKSVGVAFALWLFFGFFGGHRFYADRAGSAVGMIVLTVLGLLTLQGPFLIIAAAIWVTVDAFLIPGWIKKYNVDLVSKIAGGSGATVV